MEVTLVLQHVTLTLTLALALTLILTHVTLTLTLALALTLILTLIGGLPELPPREHNRPLTQPRFRNPNLDPNITLILTQAHPCS